MKDPTDVLLNDIGYRRRWLLAKALEEHLTLAQALQLAQAAEEFLIGSASSIAASDWIRQSEVTPSSDEDNEIVTRPGAFDALSSVVSIDDVVRYLEQRGETVVRETRGKFLVDGCFSENVEQLLARANRIRTQQGLPHFALLSDVDIGNADERDPSDPAGKAAPKRPPSARERAEWGRQVIALSGPAVEIREEDQLTE
jgi:hypothetical protein